MVTKKMLLEVTENARATKARKIDSELQQTNEMLNKEFGSILDTYKDKVAKAINKIEHMSAEIAACRVAAKTDDNRSYDLVCSHPRLSEIRATQKRNQKRHDSQLSDVNQAAANICNAVKLAADVSPGSEIHTKVSEFAKAE